MFGYLQGVFREFKFIRWLSVHKTSFLVLVVLLAAIGFGFGLGYLDGLFASILEKIVG